MLPPPFQNALILTGPTASGKSALSIDLAQKLNAEIIVMDSMTLYRGMDIGTAKPSREERALIPHHLIDVLDPSESGNVAMWLREASRCCREIESRGKQVLFVGGTPFYLKALFQGMFDNPPFDKEIRLRLEDEAKRIGPIALHARLSDIDPLTAARLHPNDIRRVIRALEVWESTGKPISVWQQQGWRHEGPEVAHKQASDPPICLVIDVSRNELISRIDRRVEAMIAAGWIEEVQKLLELPQLPSKEAISALGYREIREFLEGKSSLSETIGMIQLRTRQFAKRQMTWFRSLSQCELCEGKLTFERWRRKMS